MKFGLNLFEWEKLQPGNTIYFFYLEITRSGNISSLIRPQKVIIKYIDLSLSIIEIEHGYSYRIPSRFHINYINPKCESDVARFYKNGFPASELYLFDNLEDCQEAFRIASEYHLEEQASRLNNLRMKLLGC